MKRIYTHFPLVVITILFLTTSPLFAQEAPIKFGKIELADLQMKVFEKDSSADAVVLGDIGSLHFISNPGKGLFVEYERHCRIKIFKKSGYDYATIKVPLFHSATGSDREELYDLKAYTYNIENGQIIKEKLEKEAIFTEKKNDNINIKKFAFPNVREGSIIEFTYKIQSDFFYTLHEWAFQNTIPVVWSEFSASIIKEIHYRTNFQGYEPLFINSSTEGNSYGFQTRNYRWVMKDLPAIKEEPFTTTIDDFVSKAFFELAYIEGTYTDIKAFANSWESLNTNLLKAEDFGEQLKKVSIVKDFATTIKNSPQKDTLSQVKLAYEIIKKAIVWNEHETIFTGEPFKKVLETKTGNVADINLLLVVLLRELGYDANPVILSTRDNGRILPNYVLLSKFNYVIAQVNIGGKDLLLDATAIRCPMGVLPIRCLNGEGRLISKENPRWVSLTSPLKHTETTMANLQITPEGNAKGDLSIAHMGYSAITEQNKYVKNGEKNYLDEYQKALPTWAFEKTSIENGKEIGKPLIRKYEVSISDLANTAADHIYFKPVVHGGQTENPFKNPDRKFPVDLGTPIEESFIATYLVPEGYMVEEIPKSTKMALPEDAARFTYLVSHEESKVTISSKIQLKKPVYYAEEYEGLRKFYDQIVAKQAEQIVLKKK